MGARTFPQDNTGVVNNSRTVSSDNRSALGDVLAGLTADQWPVTYDYLRSQSGYSWLSLGSMLTTVKTPMPQRQLCPWSLTSGPEPNCSLVHARRTQRQSSFHVALWYSVYRFPCTRKMVMWHRRTRRKSVTDPNASIFVISLGKPCSGNHSNSVNNGPSIL